MDTVNRVAASHGLKVIEDACEAIGAGTCAVGAYDQDALDGALDLDGEQEFAVYMAPTGRIG